MMSLPLSNEILVDYSSEVAEKRTDVSQNNRSLFSRKDFGTDEVIAEFGWDQVHSTPTYLTVQIGEHEHILLLPEYLECINHSCDPNCFFDTTNKILVSLKPISDGEELTFFYPSAEWDMDQAFQCRCGSEQCIGQIRGAKYLGENLLKKYRFTDFIRHKLASRF